MFCGGDDISHFKVGDPLQAFFSSKLNRKNSVNSDIIFLPLSLSVANIAMLKISLTNVIVKNEKGNL